MRRRPPRDGQVRSRAFWTPEVGGKRMRSSPSTAQHVLVSRAEHPALADVVDQPTQNLPGDGRGDDRSEDRLANGDQRDQLVAPRPSLAERDEPAMQARLFTHTPEAPRGADHRTRPRAAPRTASAETESAPSRAAAKASAGSSPPGWTGPRRGEARTSRGEQSPGARRHARNARLGTRRHRQALERREVMRAGQAHRLRVAGQLGSHTALPCPNGTDLGADALRVSSHPTQRVRTPRVARWSCPRARTRSDAAVGNGLKLGDRAPDQP